MRPAFRHGWFRTGDQGFLDGEGRLRITGRLKEIMNRGGEKISPSEVDEVLMHHPARRHRKMKARAPRMSGASARGTRMSAGRDRDVPRTRRG